MKSTFPAVATALLAVLVILPAPVAGAPSQPNFVFILVDDLGWRDVGAFGSSFYETRSIDRLAASGTQFTQAYAACPVCSPTRASILTGKYPVRIGITDYIGAKQPDQWERNTKLLPAPYMDRLALRQVTIAERLQSAGYATFFAGKWHLGPEGFYPEDQGFDVNMGGHAAGGPYGGGKYFSPYANPRLEDGPEGEHLPDRLASETVQFIEANRERPFFAYLSFYSVHTPLLGREDLVEKYEKKRARPRITGEVWGKEGDRAVRQVQDHAVYAAMVEAMDQAVGKVLDALERLHLADHTVVILMSDNGGLSTSEGHPTSNVPLRAGKGWLYEGGIRVPMIVRAPGLTKPGTQCITPVASVDFFPTILELAGVGTSQVQIDGVSFVPLLRGKPLNTRPLLWHYPHYGNQGASPGGAIRHGDWKLIHWYEDDRVELYDLSEDLGETRNLAAQNLGRTKELVNELHRWLRETGAKMPTPNTAPEEP